MFRIALRMMLDDPLKSLGTLVGVVFAVLLMTQQLSILLGILGRTTALIDKNPEVDIWIASPATEGTEATSTVPEQRVRQAAGTPGVAWAAPLVVGVGEVTKANGVKELVRVVGVEPPLLAGLPDSLLPGTRPDAISTPGRIFLEWTDRKQFGFPKIGDRVEINGRIAILAGFTNGMQPFGPYYVMTNINDVRAFSRIAEGRLTYVLVKVAPGEDPIVVRDRLRARVPDTVIVTRDEFHDMNMRHFLRRTPVGYVFGLGTFLAAVIGTIIVTVTLFSSVVDRTREYATLKALGATRVDLRRLLLTQALTFAGVGFVIGLGVFGLLRTLIIAAEAPISLRTPWWVIVLVAGATVLVCMGASILAIRRVVKLEPALVFRG